MCGEVIAKGMKKSCYRGYRYPPEIIHQAIWLYLRFDGAIAGTAVDRGGSGQRGVEVAGQKDDGQTVSIAQPDNGDVQIGARVNIVYDRKGVASAIRDTGYRRDL